VSDSALRGVGLAVTLSYAAFIAWLYAANPQTFEQISGGMAAAVGMYEIDRAQFEEGRRRLRAGAFPEARAAFARADPAERDAVTQFYIAYAFYRQGWGRLWNDDALFTEAEKALERATALAPSGRVQVVDPDLGLANSDALRAELDRGLRVEADDWNPLRVFRRRQ
jgi:hypothetical protein